MTSKIFKNGNIVVKDDGVTVEIRKDSPKVCVSDPKNRYYFFFYDGVRLAAEGQTPEGRVQIAQKEIERYKQYRGTQTSWTLNDSWLENWKKKHSSVSVQHEVPTDC